MQTRHRVPAVFTLYMVDVFCCALGCVILLWLASARDAQRKGTAHEQAAKQLADTRLRLASSRSELTSSPRKSLRRCCSSFWITGR